MNLTVMWCFLLGACKMIYIFVRKTQKNCTNNTEKFMCHRKKRGSAVGSDTALQSGSS